MKRFELHLGGQEIDFSIQQENFRRVLANSIPPGLVLSLHWWSASNTENIHPRFVLTDIGDLHFDHGTDPHPRKDTWDEHFQRVGALILGRTPIGRTTVWVLQMNITPRVELRSLLLKLGELD